MIGAIVYELQAENSAWLPTINGRFMHALFFKILNDFSPTLGSFVHNEFNLKPFTVSFLEPAEKILLKGEQWSVRRGDKFFWRVTGLNREILQTALSVPVGKKFQAGNLALCVKKIICDGDIRTDSGVVAREDFISAVKNLPPVKEICFNFLSPVSFRIDNFDAPYPRAELIFSSLADKWTQGNMPAVVDKKTIRELAKEIRLCCWSGESKKFYLTHERGVLAFRGRFSYNIEAWERDMQRVYVLLARFRPNFVGSYIHALKFAGRKFPLANFSNGSKPS